VTNSDRKATSRDSDPHATLSLGSKREAGLDIRRGQVRKICKNLSGRHPCRQVREDIVNGYPHASDTWPATAFARFDGDSRTPLIIHEAPPVVMRKPVKPSMVHLFKQYHRIRAAAKKSVLELAAVAGLA
jgi:hypothetical protein